MTLTLQNRLDLLSELGHYISSGGDEELDVAVRLSYTENQWFTEENTRESLRAISGSFLDAEKLRAWASAYDIPEENHHSKVVGLIMAGNIPLVGFHDWLCVFVTGNRAKVKLSDKDRRLLPVLVNKLGEWSHQSREQTIFIGDTDKLTGFDAVIATGSNNTARYFEQYFGKYPHIIRRNRNAVAVLTGLETREELYALGKDIFMYFGLGCRNVSKLYVPHGYQFDNLLEVLHEYNRLINHNKYKNNFDYNMTLYVLNNMPYLNNGCLMLREDPSLQSRIAAVHYEYYDDVRDLDSLLTDRRDEIQCVVGRVSVNGFSVLPFGSSQEPGLFDYPDGVDVMKFLVSGEASN